MSRYFSAPGSWLLMRPRFSSNRYAAEPSSKRMITQLSRCSVTSACVCANADQREKRCHMTKKYDEDKADSEEYISK